MTPRLYVFSGALLFLFASFVALAIYWPEEKSGATLRQAVSDAIGLIGGLLALLAWVALKLPRLLVASRRQVTR